MKAFEYRFDKVFVLKSLGESDTYADALYYKTIEPCCKNSGCAKEPPIEIFDRGDWKNAIDKILNDEYKYPLVHIECHGDKVKGLELRLGDNIPWNEMLDDLRRVNVRSGMNLITTMATCFSKENAFSINMSGLPAPYLFSLTARKKVESKVTYEMYSIFFNELITTGDMYKALKRVERERPDLPSHFVLFTLPFLFEDAWKGIPEKYKNGDEVVRHFFHSFPDFQAQVIKEESISRNEFEGYRDGFVRECNANTINAIYRRCRDTFFMYDTFPENWQRFKMSDRIM